MAGGMRRRDAPSLAERSGVAPASRVEEPPSDSTSRAARHCWAEPPGHPGPWPGLVVEWRRTTRGDWHGRCVYAVTEPDGSGVRVIERWLPASCLTPVIA